MSPELVALSFYKPGYRYEFRPSYFETEDDYFAYTETRSISVSQQRTKPDYVGEVLHRWAVEHRGSPATLDTFAVTAGTFEPGDLLFVDFVSLDHGGDAGFTINLDGTQLMTGLSRQGAGGHMWLSGEYTNPSGTSTLSGDWTFEFSHSSVNWPDQSLIMTDSVNTNMSAADWITGSFTLSLIAETANPNTQRWVEWRVVRLRAVPICDIQMSQDTYVDGERITAQVFRLANLASKPVAVEIKSWLEVPGTAPIRLINAGADGSVILPAGYDQSFGPWPLFRVTPGFPRSVGYGWNCRLIAPVTGETLSTDINPFDIQ